jgi:uncharacterized membrane protein (GlpM family)
LSDVGLIALRALIAGLFVVAFAILGEVLRPKRFAGLFGAAPSIALANLIVIVAATGSEEAALSCESMIVGAVGFVAYCLVERVLLERMSALMGSVICSAVWLLVAGGLYLAVLR